MRYYSNKIYIICPIYNRRETTRKHLTCLLHQTYQKYHLIIIDDGSNDGSGEMVKQMIPGHKLTIIRGSGTWWWAGSLQQGYLWIKRNVSCENDVVLIINDDTLMNRRFLEDGLRCILEKDSSLLLAKSYSVDDAELIDRGVHINWFLLKFQKARSDKSISCLSTRGLFLKVSVLLNIGGFRHKVLPHYFSDYEFTIRAKKKKYKLITNNKVTLYTSRRKKDVPETSIYKYIQFIFSKKCPINPIYFTKFVIFSWPSSFKIVSIITVWLFIIYKITTKALQIIIRK